MRASFFFYYIHNKENLIENRPVLTLQDLLLIRAALRFWCDEISPDDTAIAANYFAPNEKGGLPKNLDAVGLLRRLEQCRICYIVCDPDAVMILHKRLFDSVDVARQNCAEHIAVVSTLVPT